VITALPRDVDAVARLTLEREGGTYEAARERAKAWLAGTAGGQNLLLVARVGRSIAGYARAGFVRAQKGEFADVPEGWYLGGIIVGLAFRRRGIGTMLTRRRIEWLAGRGAREVYYFVNSLNRPSIDLHTPFGFVELRRDFRFPGATFTGGGTGVLFRAPIATTPNE
jgi:ribosomal protein S18 acetylase RimI-like enzyme